MKAKGREEIYSFLASSLKAGISLEEALAALAEDFSRYREFNEFRKALLEGAKVHEAAQSLGAEGWEVVLLRTGEDSGNLDVVLETLASRFQKARELRTSFIKAISYPAAVLLFGFTIIFLIFRFIVPQFRTLFEQLGGYVPPLSQAVFSFANTISSPAVPLLFVSTVLAIFFLFRSNKEYLSYIPLVNRLVYLRDLSNLYLNLALYIESGAPFAHLADSLPQLVWHRRLKRYLNSNIDKIVSQSITDVLRPVIPARDYVFLEAGRRSGTLEQKCRFLSEEKYRQFQALQEVIARLSEPALIVLLGLAIGTIIIALYMPLFQLINTVR